MKKLTSATNVRTVNREMQEHKKFNAVAICCFSIRLRQGICGREKDSPIVQKLKNSSTTPRMQLS